MDTLTGSNRAGRNGHDLAVAKNLLLDAPGWEQVVSPALGNDPPGPVFLLYLAWCELLTLENPSEAQLDKTFLTHNVFSKVTR